MLRRLEVYTDVYIYESRMFGEIREKTRPQNYRTFSSVVYKREVWEGFALDSNMKRNAYITNESRICTI